MARSVSSGITVALMRVRDAEARMLHYETRSGAAIADTVASITRSTVWALIDERPLTFDAHHPQGMVRIGSTWWISTVDVGARQGYVMAADWAGNLIEQVPIGDAQRYHPGGMDFDGSALWIASAE